LKPRWIFVFFVVSGFYSLVYEIVWLRPAMASFGVTAAIVSMVLSIFMGGLAIGSWAADLVEWEPNGSARSIFDAILNQELSLEALIAVDPNAPVLADDRPVNKYYLLHRLAHPRGAASTASH
jgi:hypothetical protein